MFVETSKKIKHYNVIVSTDNATSIQTAATPTHASLFLENALMEINANGDYNAGRVVIIVEPYYGE